MGFWDVYYDPATKKIYNAKKDTLIFFHEEGHKKIDSKKIGYLDEYFNSILLLILACLIAGMRLLAVIPFMILVILTFFEEVYCWIYAFNQYLKKRGMSTGDIILFIMAVLLVIGLILFLIIRS